MVVVEVGGRLQVVAVGGVLIELVLMRGVIFLLFVGVVQLVILDDDVGALGFLVGEHEVVEIHEVVSVAVLPRVYQVPDVLQILVVQVVLSANLTESVVVDSALNLLRREAAPPRELVVDGLLVFESLQVGLVPRTADHALVRLRAETLRDVPVLVLIRVVVFRSVRRHRLVVQTLYQDLVLLNL